MSDTGFGGDRDRGGFGGDRGVVLARQPVGVLAAHAVVAREHVLRRVRGTVADVRRAGDVRRRHRDDKRRPAGVDLGVINACGEVARDQSRLNLSRVVRFC